MLSLNLRNPVYDLGNQTWLSDSKIHDDFLPWLEDTSQHSWKATYQTHKRYVSRAEEEEIDYYAAVKIALIYHITEKRRFLCDLILTQHHVILVDYDTMLGKLDQHYIDGIELHTLKEMIMEAIEIVKKKHENENAVAEVIAKAMERVIRNTLGTNDEETIQKVIEAANLTKRAKCLLDILREVHLYPFSLGDNKLQFKSATNDIDSLFDVHYNLDTAALVINPTYQGKRVTQTYIYNFSVDVVGDIGKAHIISKSDIDLFRKELSTIVSTSAISLNVADDESIPEQCASVMDIFTFILRYGDVYLTPTGMILNCADDAVVGSYACDNGLILIDIGDEHFRLSVDFDDDEKTMLHPTDEELLPICHAIDAFPGEKPIKKKKGKKSSTKTPGEIHVGNSFADNTYEKRFVQDLVSGWKSIYFRTNDPHYSTGPGSWDQTMAENCANEIYNVLLNAGYTMEAITERRDSPAVLYQFERKNRQGNVGDSVYIDHTNHIKINKQQRDGTTISYELRPTNVMDTPNLLQMTFRI